MCIFHEALSIESAFPHSPIVVALSGLQKGATLLNELSSIQIEDGQDVGSATRLLLQVAQDPYRYLRAMLSFEADKGHGRCAVNALTKELAQPSVLRFHDPVPASETARQIISASSIEETLRLVALAGHSSRPAFLAWFRDNPPGLEAPRAIKFLCEVAQEVLVNVDRAVSSGIGLPVLDTLPVQQAPERDCCQPRP